MIGHKLQNRIVSSKFSSMKLSRQLLWYTSTCSNNIWLVSKWCPSRAVKGHTRVPKVETGITSSTVREKLNYLVACHTGFYKIEGSKRTTIYNCMKPQLDVVTRGKKGINIYYNTNKHYHFKVNTYCTHFFCNLKILIDLKISYFIKIYLINLISFKNEPMSL